VEQRRCRAYHAREFEGVNPSNASCEQQETFETHCFEGKLTFGDPFEDSGVVGFRKGVGCEAHGVEFGVRGLGFGVEVHGSGLRV